MDVTLVYVGITESGFNSLKGNEGSWMNHGLAVISSAAKQAGHNVDLLDLRRLSSWEDFEQRVGQKKSRVYGLTLMSVDFNAGVQAAQLIRKASPDSKIIVGGPHASICPQELDALSCFDHIVVGEGEITFPLILKSIEENTPLERVIQGERPENLDESPWADRDLFNCPEEPFVSFLPPPFVTVIAGRGCKYNCNYCQPAERLMFGKKVRRRSVDNVIAELEYLRGKFHFNSFMIHDDCITEDKPWVMEFCRQLSSHGFTQPFVCQSRADLICKYPDMVKALYNAGARLFIIGFESGSNRVLNFLRKGCTREQNLQAAKNCRELGIKIWANYMMGLPTETREEVMETYTMLQEISPYHCSPAFYTPHPGSDLYTLGEEMGIHIIHDHNSYRRNTYDPKIKGPDYEFLQQMLYKSIALAEDSRHSNPPQVADGTAATAVMNAATEGRARIKNLIMRYSPRLFCLLKQIKNRLVSK